MGFLNSLSETVKAKMNKIADNMENPNETLDFSYNKQLELIGKMNKGITGITTQKKRMELQKGKLEQKIIKLQAQAKEALSLENGEAIAKMALTEKVNLTNQLDEVNANIMSLKDQETKLIATRDDLKTKVELFRSKKEVLKAEYDTSKVTTSINESLTGITNDANSIQASIDKIEEKIEKNKARSQAIDELVENGSLTSFGDSTLDSKLNQAQIDAQVAAEMEKLKTG
jgi:phage shock protein A